MTKPYAERLKRTKTKRKQTALGEFDFDWFGSVSRDGQFITFVQWETGDLAVRELNSGRIRNLTNKKGSWEYNYPPESRAGASNEFVYISAISPDSKQVAYAWFGDDGPSLRLIGLDGSGQRVLHRDKDIISYEPRDWSPDAQHVLVTFVRKHGTNQIVLLPLEDGSVRVLQNLAGLRTPLRMKFSPDGRYIAYDFPTGERSTDWDIFVMSADGKTRAAVVKQPGHDLLIDWTPDGKRLLFASKSGAAWGLWVVSVVDGKRRGVPESVKKDLGQLLFPLGLTSAGSLYYGIATWMRELYFGKIDPVSGNLESSPTLVTQLLGSSAHWSPDGRRLAYLKQLAPIPTWATHVAYSWALVIRSMETGKQREIPVVLSPASASAPRWSPDGRSLLTSGVDPKGLEGVYRIDAQTGDVQAVAQQKGRGDSRVFKPGCAVWSPDGKAVFYRRLSGGRLSILKRALSTGEEKELVGAEAPSYFLGSSFAVSPDGRWLAFVAGESKPGQVSASLKIMPSTGGEARELVRTQQLEMDVRLAGSSQLAWMPDGHSLSFGKTMASQGQQKFELWRISAEGGPPQKLGLAMEGRIVGLSVHPDGRRIALTAESLYRSELSVLENFLPAVRRAKQ